MKKMFQFSNHLFRVKGKNTKLPTNHMNLIINGEDKQILLSNIYLFNKIK